MRLTFTLAALAATALSFTASAQELTGTLKKIKETESLMQKLQKQIQGFTSQLEDPVLYEKEPQKAIRINKEMSDAKSALAEAEDKWLEMSSEYEEAMAD